MVNRINPEKHPPIGTYGIVINVEDWEDSSIGANLPAKAKGDIDQFVCVHWAHHQNDDDQIYFETSLKKARP